MDYASVDAALRDLGLIARGGFHPGPEDGAPSLGDGQPAGTLVLVGNAGPDLWEAFAAAPEIEAAPDPLDRWTRRVLTELADRLGAEALFPFGGPPYLPFVRWAKRAEPVTESPLGMLIHPDYGLWHAYRGALAFAAALNLPPKVDRPRPCDTCADTPCLSACPVGAFTDEGYDVTACTDHIAAPEGADCLDLGCRARRACPVGRDYLYAPAQAYLHMAAFLAARRRAAAAS